MGQVCLFIIITHVTKYNYHSECNNNDTRKIITEMAPLEV